VITPLAVGVVKVISVAEPLQIVAVLLAMENSGAGFTVTT
jgi:hypothetical protein